MECNLIFLHIKVQYKSSSYVINNLLVLSSKIRWKIFESIPLRWSLFRSIQIRSLIRFFLSMIRQGVSGNKENIYCIYFFCLYLLVFRPTALVRQHFGNDWRCVHIHFYRWIFSQNLRSWLREYLWSSLVFLLKWNIWRGRDFSNTFDRW